MAGSGRMSGRKDTGSKKKMTEMSDRSIDAREAVYGGDSPSEKARSKGSSVKDTMVATAMPPSRPKDTPKTMVKKSSTGKMMPVSMPPKRPADAPKAASKSDKSKDVAMNFGANAVRTRAFDK